MITILDYCPEVLEKVAAEPERPKGRIAPAAKVIGVGALGFGAGTLLGAGAAALANKAHEKMYGAPIPTNTFYRVAPVLGGAMGISYALFKAREQEELRRVYQDDQHRAASGLPRK